MAFHLWVAHLANQVHILLNLMQILFTLTAELEVHYDGSAIGGNHYAVGAAVLQHSSVAVYD